MQEGKCVSLLLKMTMNGIQFLLVLVLIWNNSADLNAIYWAEMECVSILGLI